MVFFLAWSPGESTVLLRIASSSMDPKCMLSFPKHESILDGSESKQCVFKVRII